MMARSWSWPVLGGLCLALGLLLEGCNDNGSDGGFLEVDDSSDRLGSFLVIGDWGWAENMHGNLESRQCQQAIADQMHETMASLGDVKFVINVGDSFYPGGVKNKSDPLWDEQWRNVYSSRVRSVPWYSVYGNHDYVVDPCACSENVSECAQINADIDDLEFFYMPDTSWFREHPELESEVIAMDTNYYAWLNYTCPYTSCPGKCAENLKKRADEAFRLFHDRVAASNATNLIVFSHYPTDYFPGPEFTNASWAEDLIAWVSMDEEDLPAGLHTFLPELSNASRGHIEYFGGHRHNVDQTTVASTAPHSNWVVGGGGGWGTDGSEQGFVVGEIRAGGVVSTYAVTVNMTLCS